MRQKQGREPLQSRREVTGTHPRTENTGNERERERERDRHGFRYDSVIEYKDVLPDSCRMGEREGWRERKNNLQKSRVPHITQLHTRQPRGSARPRLLSGGSTVLLGGPHPD